MPSSDTSEAVVSTDAPRRQVRSMAGGLHMVRACPSKIGPYGPGSLVGRIEPTEYLMHQRCDLGVSAQGDGDGEWDCGWVVGRGAVGSTRIRKNKTTKKIGRWFGLSQTVLSEGPAWRWGRTKESGAGSGRSDWPQRSVALAQGSFSHSVAAGHQGHHRHQGYSVPRRRQTPHCWAFQSQSWQWALGEVVSPC